MGPTVWPNVCVATLRRVVGGDELKVDAEGDSSELVDMLPNCAGTERRRGQSKESEMMGE